VPDFEIEDLYKRETVCGADEAGMGSWAGPLVVASCLFLGHTLPPSLISLNDSKKVLRSRRESLFEELMKCPLIRYGIAVINESLIDEAGLAEAWRIGVVKSVSGLHATICIIDGTRWVDIPGIVKCIPLVRGDGKSYSIAAASIIAKVTRDRIMLDIHREFPGYGFDRNVGYGTRYHMESISKLGVCERHRRSYAPIRKFIMGHSPGFGIQHAIAES
jgi:ribonuclease HII